MTQITKEQLDAINEGIQIAEYLQNKIEQSVGGNETPKSISSVVSITLFMRIMDLYSSSILCIKGRKPISSYVLIRTMSEAMVLLKGSTTDPNFSKELHNKSANNKKNRLINIAKDLNHSGINLTSLEIKELIEVTETEKMKDIATAANSYAIFKKFEELPRYHMVFSHCSLYAHNDPQSLGDYFGIDENGSIRNIDYNKEFFKNSILTLLMSMSLLLHSSEHISDFLKIEIKDKELLAKRYNDYAEKLNTLIDLEKQS